MKNQSTLRKQADLKQFCLQNSNRVSSPRSINSSWDKGDNIAGFFGKKKTRCRY